MTFPTMSHAFAKDSRACAACVSWGGARCLSPDQTLVEVERYSLEAECRTAASQDYRRVTKAYHTCGRWAPLPQMKAHGARPSRVTGTGAAPASPATAATPVAVRAAVAATLVPEDLHCHATPVDIDKAPQALQVVYGHWHRLKQDRRFPAASEIDTAQVREAVARLCLLAPEGGEFVYRACGRAILRRLTVRPVGKRVSDCHPAEAAARFNADLKACLDRGEALCRLVRNDPMLPPGQRFIELLLPLADAAGRRAFVLAYRHVPGG
jgi:hypothetical protein